MPSVLVIDDEQLLLWALVKRLRKAGFEAEGAESAEEGLHKLETHPVGLVVLDLRLPGMDGIECLGRIKEDYPETVVVMITAHGDIQSAVQAMQLGAYNYLSKPFEFREVLAIAQSVLGPGKPVPRTTDRFRKTTGEEMSPTQDITDSGFGIDSLLGESAAMKQVKALLLKVARSRTTTILLTGESGTGKDHVAKVIHYNSDRSNSPFVHVNVASLAPTLFESELFGHEKGAFTGAAVRKRGLLEVAQGGSVYLDEIGELDGSLQADLLHVLEERSYKRVGGTKELIADVRFIAATNADLRNKVAEGKFRKDLYYRLRVIPIELPPLRERSDDVFVLAEAFVQKFAEQFSRKNARLSPEALQKLRTHSWPGNVRELRNVIERAAILGEDGCIESDTITFDEPIVQHGVGENEFLSDSGMNLDEMERKLIQKALERADWNQVKAAEYLGLGRDALRYRMKKHELL